MTASRLMPSGAPASSVEGVSAHSAQPVPRSPVLIATDVVVATLLAAMMTVSALRPGVVRIFEGPVWLRIAIGMLSALAVATRRPAPVASLAVATIGSTTAWMYGFERASFLAVALVLFIIGSTRPPRRSGLLLLAAATVTVIGCVVNNTPQVAIMRAVPEWWQIIGFAATPLAFEAVGWAVGMAVYRQRSYVEAVKTQAAQEVHTQRELAARAAAEERLRIARELHDVVAHAMSVITVQAGVARYIDASMPEQTSAALETIESTGRQALRDMRQLLGVLRADGERSPNSPAPALSDLDELVEGLRGAGTSVELRVGGDVRRLPEGLELSAYRIVQEALTNVVKHASTDRARVDLRYEPGELAIEIVDDGAGALAGMSGGGHGLVGMRERAALHGGSLEAGPLPVRGYRVAARLPVPGPLEAVAA